MKSDGFPVASEPMYRNKCELCVDMVVDESGPPLLLCLRLFLIRTGTFLLDPRLSSSIRDHLLDVFPVSTNLVTDIPIGEGLFCGNCAYDCVTTYLPCILMLCTIFTRGFWKRNMDFRQIVLHARSRLGVENKAACIFGYTIMDGDRAVVNIFAVTRLWKIYKYR